MKDHVSAERVFLDQKFQQSFPVDIQKFRKVKIMYHRTVILKWMTSRKGTSVEKSISRFSFEELVLRRFANAINEAS